VKVPLRRSLRRALVLCAVLAGAAAFLFYGPFESFRLLWINTAMYSSHFTFLATSLYTPAYIASVLEGNRAGSTGKTRIVPLPEANLGGSVLCVPVKGNYYKGYLLKVDDPKRLSLVSSSRKEGMLLEELAAAHGASHGINAGGYAGDKTRGIPSGILIMDGQMVNRGVSKARHVMGGFREDGLFAAGAFTREEIPALDYVWAVEFGPLLILNGEKTALNAFSGGLSPRTAIGQREDGSVLLLVIDGRQPGSIGATYQDIQTILYDNGAVNAFGLDGGSSSTLLFNGALANSPSGGKQDRLLPNAILF
jgi:exopolysaccharide biosynthesis protein